MKDEFLIAEAADADVYCTCVALKGGGARGDIVLKCISLHSRV